jgi:hypothetical protein
MATVTGTVQNSQQIEGTVLDPARVTAEVIVAIKGDKGDTGDKGDPGEGGSMDGEFEEVFFDSETGTLDLSTAQSDKVFFNRWNLYELPEVEIVSFGIANAGIKKQIWFKLANSDEQSTKILSDLFAEIGINIFGFEHDQHLHLVDDNSRNYSVEVSSLGSGRWVVTSYGGNNNIDTVYHPLTSLTENITLKFINDDIYTYCVLSEDIEFGFDILTGDENKNGTKKTFIIVNSGDHALTFDENYTILSGVYDNRSTFYNIVNIIYSGIAGILVDIISQAITNNTKFKGTTVGELTTADIPDSEDKRYVTEAEKAKLAGIAMGATANDTDANLKSRANHTGTQTADTITNGFTNKAYTATEQSKLAGIATGATANDTDANLKSRANHTGTQTADTITDGTTNKSYTATEKIKLAGIATGATANDTDANLKSRANHTGTQTADTITDGTTNKAYTATEKIKLAGIATGANNYSHPNHSGDVTSTGDGSTVIASGAITYDKLNNSLKNSGAVSASEIDWSSSAIFTKTITGTTTFTFSNLQLNKVITLMLTGNFTVNLPSYCKRISGVYAGTVSNYIQFHCINDGSGTEQVWYTINKVAT